MIKLKINNKEVEVEEGTTLIRAARAMGIEVPDDPDDAKVLATAVAGEVDALLGNDHHLLDLAETAPIPILRPGAFLREWGL